MNAELYGCSLASFVAEIVFFLFKVGSSMLEPSVRLFIYQAVCLQEFNEDQTCHLLTKLSQRENLVQGLATNYIMAYKILLNLPALLLGLFCGAWSDNVGRKLPIVLPCLGAILAVLFYMVSMVNFIPSLPFVLAGAAVNGAFGKSAVITMAVHSYLTDITSKENRTHKLGKLLAMNFFGYFAGSLLAGALLEVSTFDVIFCVVVFINFLAVIITLLFMRESLPETEVNTGTPKKKTFPFKLNHVSQSVSVLIKPRKDRVRCHLISLFAIVMFHQLCKSGEVDITMLFVERSPLSWRKALYGYLLAADYACLGMAVFFLLPLLTKYVLLSDLTLILIGISFKIVRLLIMSFSTETWMVFLSVVVSAPSAMVISGGKSLISKIIADDEIGKTFSLLSCGETVANLLGSLIFNNVYNVTLFLYPGFTFTMDAVFYIVAFFLVLVLAQDFKLTQQCNLLEGVKDPTTYGAATGDTDYLAKKLAQFDDYPTDPDPGKIIPTGLETKLTTRLDFRKDEKHGK